VTFASISLCNLCYKIIAKLLANRLRPILSKGLAEEQLGFLHGRQILDAVGTAQESLHSIKQKKQRALILKLDLMKAYDLINWDFLTLILHKVGFSLATIRWIMSCVSSVSYAVIINGEPSAFFQRDKGLRQGCPLSPLLFIMVMESLSLLINREKFVGTLTGITVSRIIKILHLLFVDDILIMSRENIDEWAVIVCILNIFQSATGLQINAEKSLFLTAGLVDSDLIPFKALFPYHFEPFETGFKYLGFFLKPNRYLAEDWSWLICKFEKRVDHWCNRWLTLGGRLVLIKVVLMGLSVYWMSMSAILISVLGKLRQIIFSFLWSGCKEKNRPHLINWESLAKPKSAGGWGIKHLASFNKALLEKTLWRGLTTDGIWQKILKINTCHSYLFQIGLDWRISCTEVSSSVWKNLQKAKPLLDHWLCWKVGSGTSIQVGKDHLMGLGKRSILSPGLLSVLKHRGIVFLFQVRNSPTTSPLNNYWKDATELALRGDQATEWELYRQALASAGILITSIEDELCWEGGDGTVSQWQKTSIRHW
jgi:hypothetical protein